MEKYARYYCNIYFASERNIIRWRNRGDLLFMKILVTGAAGFIGANLCERLLSNDHSVVGIDNFNDYYEVGLKRDRIKQIQQHEQRGNFSLLELSLEDRLAIAGVFQDNEFDVVVNLAAQAGVRYSLENPASYIDSNLVAFGNILEACRHNNVKHLVYASSSSVYGANDNFPFKESDRVDAPISLYAATKKANELMAHSYSHLYDLRCTGLRFFTVYGPWGRPDMAPFRFASRMLKGEAIPVYNQGNMIRDFTFIDDINEGVVRITESQTGAQNKVYNIGRGEPVQLMDYIHQLSHHLGVEVKIDLLPMQDGDVPRTLADTTELQADYGYAPSISSDEGNRRFADWFKAYYG